MPAPPQTSVTLEDLLAEPKFYALDLEERRNALGQVDPERFGKMEAIEQDRFLAWADLKRQREMAPPVPGMERLGKLPEAGRPPVVPGLDVPRAIPAALERPGTALAEGLRPAIETVSRLDLGPSPAERIVRFAATYRPADRVADFVGDFVERNITSKHARPMGEPMARFELLFPPPTRGEGMLPAGVRGMAEALSGFTSAEAVMSAGALGGIGTLGKVGQEIFRGALSLIAGTATLGFGKNVVSGAQKFVGGDPEGAARDWGFGTVDGLLAALAGRAAVRGLPELQKAFQGAREGRQRASEGLGGPGAPPGGAAGPEGGPPAGPGPAVRRQFIEQVDPRTGRVSLVEVEARGPEPTKEQTSFLDRIIDETLRREAAGEPPARPGAPAAPVEPGRVPESESLVADLLREGARRREEAATRAVAEHNRLDYDKLTAKAKEQLAALVRGEIGAREVAREAIREPERPARQEIPADSPLGRALAETERRQAGAREGPIEPQPVVGAPEVGPLRAPVGAPATPGAGGEPADRLKPAPQATPGAGGEPADRLKPAPQATPGAGGEPADRLKPVPQEIPTQVGRPPEAAAGEAPAGEPGRPELPQVVEATEENIHQGRPFYDAEQGKWMVELGAPVEEGLAEPKPVEEVVETVPAPAQRGAPAAAPTEAPKEPPKLTKQQGLMVEAVKRQTDAIEKYASLEIARGTAPERRKALESYYRSLQHYAAQLGVTVPPPTWKPEAMREAARQVRAEIDAALEASGLKKPTKAAKPTYRLVATGLRQAADKLDAAIRRLKPAPQVKGRGQKPAEDLAREAGRLERFQGTLRALAEAMEQDRVPPSLAKIRNKSQVQQLLELEHYPGPGVLKAAGIQDEAGFNEARDDLLKLAPAQPQPKPAPAPAPQPEQRKPAPPPAPAKEKPPQQPAPPPVTEGKRQVENPFAVVAKYGLGAWQVVSRHPTAETAARASIAYEGDHPGLSVSIAGPKQETREARLKQQGKLRKALQEARAEAAQRAAPLAPKAPEKPKPSRQTTTRKAAWEMTAGEFRAEYEETERRVDAAEKHGPLPPGMREWTPETWKEWSRRRGYTEAEISDFERYLELAETAEHARDDLALVHQRHVQRALRRGKPVPPEVMAEYPDLKEPGRFLRLRLKPLEPAKAKESAREVKHRRIVPGKPVTLEIGEETTILIPGEERRYTANYAVVEADALVASHDAETFQPEADYPYVNDRDYSKATNQQRIREQRTKFDPAFLVTDDPSPENGPPMIEHFGRVLGGNARTIILKWIYEHEPGAAQRYRDQLARKLRNFGLAPIRLNEFKQPVLVRLILTREDFDPQEAITDLNKVGTAALTPAERALADSRRVSEATLDFIALRIDEAGAEGTLAQALEGDGGPAIVARLVADGVITPQAKGEYIEQRTVKGTERKYEVLTEEGKKRIARLLIGRLFRDTNQFEATPPELRAKLERLVAPIVRVEQRDGWNILGWVREAIDLLQEMRAHGVRSVNDYLSQASLWPTTEGYSEPAAAIARTLQLGPLNAVKVFRTYAAEEAKSREGAPASFFTPLGPEEAFRAAFIERREEIEKAERKPKAKAAGAGDEPLTLMREQLPPAFERTVRRGERWHLRGKPLKPWREGMTPAEILESAEARLIEGGKDDPSVVLVNRQAAIVLAEAGGVNGAFTGWLLRPGRARFLLKRLFRELAKGQPQAQREAIAGLFQAIGAAHLAGGYVVLVRPGREVVQRVRHELHHRQQYEIAPRMADLLGDKAVEFLGDPVARRMADKLKDWGYPHKSETLAAEVGAYLAAGPKSWQAFGIDRQQALTLITRYLEYIVSVHGRQALAVFRRAAPDFRRVLEDVRRSSEQLREVAGGTPGRQARGGLRRDVSGGEEPALQRDLFPKYDSEQQREAEAAQQRRIEGERLTAEFNSALTQSNLRQKLKPRRTIQGNLFGAPDPEPEQGSLFDSQADELPQGGLFGDEPLLMRAAGERAVRVLGAPEAAGALREAAANLRQFKDDVQRVFVPAARGERAKQAALSLRAHGAEMARSFDKTERALVQARKFFRGQSHEFIAEFIDRMEEGQAQETRELDEIAGLFRRFLDERRREVQGLGTGKLTAFHETYFPHVWKQRGPQDATQAFRQVFGRRPLEGPKAFLKKRKHLFFREGLEAQLEPVSWNPVDLVLLKIREMDRYLLAHRFIKEMKDLGLCRFTAALGGHAPAGWAEVPDPIGSVWGPPELGVREAYDAGVMRELEALAKSLGISHERLTSMRGPAWGYAYPGKSEVKTRFAGPESVYIHEIGHVLDHRYGLAEQLVKTTPYREELRLLADLRIGEKASPHFRKYIRRKAEKMANLVAAYVHAPEAFERVAPATFVWFEDFLDAHPELARLKTIKYGMELAEGRGTFPLGGFVLKGKWYMPEQAVQVLKNFLSPGLRQKGWFRQIMGVANWMVQFTLSWSTFHLANTSLDAMISKLSLAMMYGLAGMPTKALLRILELPGSPIQNAVRGNKLMKAWFAEGVADPEVGKVIDAALAAGARVRMDPVYQTGWRERWMETLAQIRESPSIPKALKLAWSAPFALTELSAWPIMEWVVPRMKLGAFYDMVLFELERLPADASREQVRKVFARAWDSVDNRLGQLVYDNLFWNRYAKDLGMVTVQSLGWNLGTFREIGGGYGDVIRLGVRAGKRAIGAVRGGPGPGGTPPPPTPPGGEPPPPPTPEKPIEFTHRMGYTIGLVLFTGFVGGLVTYLRTGKAPEDHRDWFFPRTGTINPDGTIERVNLPTYLKDQFHWYDHPIQAARNKLNPAVRVTAELLANEDFWGTLIRDPHDPAYKQVLESLVHALEGATPISVQAWRQETKRGASTAMKLLPYAGVTRAPRYITDTPAERLLSEFRGEQRGGPQTKEAAERAEMRREIVRALRERKGAGPLITRALQEGKIDRDDLTQMLRQATTPRLVSGVKGLGLDQALEIWEVAKPEERKQIRGVLLVKFVNAMQSKAPQEMRLVRERHGKAIREVMGR
ncbi:MAG: hypothetical protein FJW34_04565 [Acidobacteria bacterium]|nr:hypothetical protein [Acidobacteriota bacterium]